MSIDNLLDRTWSKDYTCNEFTCEAWQQITGQDLTKRLADLINGHGEFEKLNEPIAPCIVYFENHKNSPAHVGVFFDQKVLHLTGRGVHLMPLEIVSTAFKEVSYYR